MYVRNRDGSVAVVEVIRRQGARSSDQSNETPTPPTFLCIHVASLGPWVGHLAHQAASKDVTGEGGLLWRLVEGEGGGRVGLAWGGRGQRLGGWGRSPRASVSVLGAQWEPEAADGRNSTVEANSLEEV